MTRGVDAVSTHKHRADITLTSVRNQDTYITNRTGMVSSWNPAAGIQLWRTTKTNTCLHLNSYEKESDDGNDRLLQRELKKVIRWQLLCSFICDLERLEKM